MDSLAPCCESLTWREGFSESHALDILNSTRQCSVRPGVDFGATGARTRAATLRSARSRDTNRRERGHPASAGPGRLARLAGVLSHEVARAIPKLCFERLNYQ